MHVAFTEIFRNYICMGNWIAGIAKSASIVILLDGRSPLNTSGSWANITIIILLQWFMTAVQVIPIAIDHEDAAKQIIAPPAATVAIDCPSRTIARAGHAKLIIHVNA